MPADLEFSICFQYRDFTMPRKQNCASFAPTRHRCTSLLQSVIPGSFQPLLSCCRVRLLLLTLTLQFPLSLLHSCSMSAFPSTARANLTADSDAAAVCPDRVAPHPVRPNVHQRGHCNVPLGQPSAFSPMQLASQCLPRAWLNETLERSVCSSQQSHWPVQERWECRPCCAGLSDPVHGL